MDSYLMYVAVATLTIVVPGPGVIMTINHAVQRGFLKSIAGVLGISFGVLIVAAISATGLGVLLANSALAFTALKYVGALYLIYMGVKMWRSGSKINISSRSTGASFARVFLEGIALSISNPKSLVFFTSIFPQFVDPTRDSMPQFVALALTFASLILVIHTAYALVSTLAKSQLLRWDRRLPLNKVSGGLLVGFGVGLGSSSR